MFPLTHPNSTVNLLPKYKEQTVRSSCGYTLLPTENIKETSISFSPFLPGWWEKDLYLPIGLFLPEKVL